MTDQDAWDRFASRALGNLIVAEAILRRDDPEPCIDGDSIVLMAEEYATKMVQARSRAFPERAVVGRKSRGEAQ
jgi:hypothetical protein